MRDGFGRACDAPRALAAGLTPRNATWSAPLFLRQVLRFGRLAPQEKKGGGILGANMLNDRLCSEGRPLISDERNETYAY